MLFKVIPLQWLTPAKKAVATPPGEPTLYIDLSPKELRERYAESFVYRLKSNIQRANIVGNHLHRNRESATRKAHYLLIGELCVRFSSLEQGIKMHLRRFDDNEKHEWRSGKGLVDVFKKALERNCIDEEHIAIISAFLAEFLAVAEARNNTLKALYAYFPEENKMHKVNFRAFNYRFTEFNSLNGYMNSWIQTFDEEQHRELIATTIGLTKKFWRIEREFILRFPHLA